MRETQRTVSDWAVSTFGKDGSPAMTAAHALQKMGELARVAALESNAPAAQARIAEDAADVAIVLLQLAERLGVSDITQHPPPSSGLIVSHGHAVRAAAGTTRLLSELFEEVVWGGHQTVIEHYLIQTYAGLGEVARLAGHSLPTAIDAKMGINRQRVWRRDGDGCGRHQP